MSLEVNIEKKLDGFTLRAAFTAGNTSTALLGASGCGKSMTLRCIAGIVKPDRGRIVLDGRVLFDSAQHIDLPPQQRGVGLLFQNYALFPNMTVEQNILCGLKTEKDPAARRVACAEMLRAMRLETLAKRYPAQLSGGQQQRAALARILVGKPRILMLDEPFSALDSYLREEVEGEVGSLLANFVGTALLVTHNRDEAYRLCKEMIVLNEGQVLRAGTTKAVFADPQSIAAARLTGCKNILPCTPLDSHTVRLDGWDTTLRLVLPVPAGCTAVGIRAHDFTPCAADAPNAIPVKAVSTSENPFDWNLICTSPEGAAQLWWKVGKTSLSAAAPEPPQYLCAAPESIMPLKGRENEWPALRSGYIQRKQSFENRGFPHTQSSRCTVRCSGCFAYLCKKGSAYVISRQVTMSAPVPQTSVSTTSPTWMGACSTTLSSAATTSVICPLGTGLEVLTGQRECRQPSARTVLVMMRVGWVSSSLP